MSEKKRGAILTAAAGLTDVGRQRRHNEDHILVRPDLGLYVVADGMGGHNAGNVASALVTTSIDNYFHATKDEPPPDAKPEDAGLAEDARRIAHAVRKANRDVYEISSTHQQHHGMGSTIVAMHLPPGKDEIHIAHVGDSRCYRVRRGEIKQLTRDHSLINDALEIKPDLTEADLARLPKNIITRALGMKDVVKVDVKSEKIEAGDIYLLCSDGLSGMVRDPDICDVLGMAEMPADACEVLIAMANDAGGTDNISAVVLRIEEPEPVASVRTRTNPRSIYPRSITASTPPPEVEVAAAEDMDVFSDSAPVVDLHLDVEAPKKPSKGQPALAVKAIVAPGEGDGLADGSDLLIADEQDIGALAEMLDDEEAAALHAAGVDSAGVDSVDQRDPTDEPERLTIPFDLPAARCRNCRADLLIGARFCVECGEPMQISA
ncbi:MAG: protein phosphatase 2C domain-containing protein [Polyangiaceae bacterium]